MNYEVTMATMHSRCYFSITIYGNDAVTIMVSFGGPIVKHSCAMNIHSACRIHARVGMEL